MHLSCASLFSPKGILSRSCSRLKCWSTIHRVTFSDSSGRGMTTFCWVLVCVAGAGWGTGTVSKWMECQNHIHRGCTLCNVMFRTSGQSTSTQTKWQLQSPLSMLRKTCILYVSSDPSTWFQTLGRKCKLQIFVFFMKSCSTWEIILIDSKQLKLKKAQRSSVNPLFSHRCVICIYFLCDTYLVLSAELPLHLLASICQQCLSWV